MPLTVEQFCERLTSSGIISADELNCWLATLSEEQRPTDGESMAGLLVDQKRLTKYQAEQILAGRGDTLVLGNYVILEKLGQGGMGLVLKAMHRRMERVVAIKVMSPDGMKSPDAVLRFHREVKAAAKLSHPNIVAAHDADEAKGTHFLVMEFVDGADLSAVVKKHGPLSVDRAVKCIVQAARGLEFAHEQGVVHRDIKPANLLIDAKGTVKILDMGLARVDGSVGGSSDGASLTATGTIMGTVDYMSPEQAMDTKHADARSDIYSLGCALYYLVTGKVVYSGDTVMKKLMAHQNGPIPSLIPRGDSGTVDLDSRLGMVDSTFRRMVAKRPEDRPQSMSEVLAELEEFFSGDTVTEVRSRSGTTDRGAELQNLVKAGSGNPGSGTSVGPVARQASSDANTAVEADPRLSETMISSAGEAGTNPQTLTAAQSKQLQLSRTSAITLKPKKRSRVVLGSVAVAVALLLAIGIAVRNQGVTRKHDQQAESSNALPQTSPQTPTPQTPAGYTNGLGMEFVLVPKGKSWLWGRGGTPGEKEVEIKEDFYLGKYEVTQEEWEKVLGNMPSHFSRSGTGRDAVKDIPDEDLKRFPVEQVSYDDIQLFLRQLNNRDKQEGWVYRLPQSVEWVYACRGGPCDKLDSAFGYYLENPTLELQPEQANCRHDKSLNRTCKVGSFKPNKLGLYDMHGNVLEWSDTREDSMHLVSLGGSWYHPTENCWAEGVMYGPSTNRYSILGFRVARVAVGKVLIASPPSPAVAPFDAAQARAHQEAWAKHLGEPVETTNSVGQKMILIPPGEFLLNGKTQVTLDKPFRLGATEVTVEQFKRFAAAKGYETEMERAEEKASYLNPGYSITDECPAVFLSWMDADAYCAWLSEKEKSKYRLPKSEEWEFACRAGTTSTYSFGDDFALFQNYAWGAWNAEGKTHSVGTKLPNAFGLFDMHGNVWEFASPPAFRGGGIENNRPDKFTSSAVEGFGRDPRLFTLGFRVLQEVDASVTSNKPTAPQ